MSPRKPDWLKIKLPNLAEATNVISLLGKTGLNTICQSGLCPNRGECWGNGTATFMIGGDTCTRACRFCNVKTGNPKGHLDSSEIRDIVRSVRELKLRHVVLTSVDRDDLPDGGASHWASLLDALREECPGVTIETLIPDFQGNPESIDMILSRRPEVVSHNLETVERLTPKVRCTATYRGSLDVLRRIAEAGLRAKSGIMLGLGEKTDEVVRTMDDLLETGCSVMTIGQYLQPSERHYPVAAYIEPRVFEQLRQTALEKGFRHVESSPFVRSSYHAERHARE